MSQQSSPLLDDYNNTGVVSPGLQQALDAVRRKLPQFQGLPAPTAPDAPAPRLQPPAAPVPSITRTSASPPPTAAPAAPTITDPDAAAHLAERDRLIRTGSGVSQVHNPVARGLLRAADVIGSGFAPNITAGIPGTELHHQYLVKQAEGNVDKDVTNARENATTAETEARLPLTQAQTREANARATTEELNRPKSLLDLFMRDNPTGTAEQYADFENRHRAITNDFEAWAADPANKGKPVSEYMKLKASSEAAGKEGEQPIGDRADQLNRLLAGRFQVLNPGKTLPDEYKLPANATQKDYDRIDKSLEATEKAAASKAQQEEINALRRQAADAAAETRKEREDTQGRRVVTGTEPGTGRTVVGSVAEATAGKWTGVMDLPAAEQSQVYNGRHWLGLVGNNPKADPVKDPDRAGIMQLIDALDKRGALGMIASRWNDFIVGKGGSTGNPETDSMVEALRVKMGLSNTLLMKVHVGNRGGSFMLEHFEDLANAKKMNANTLRAGVKSEVNYVDRLAGIPGGDQGGGETVPTVKTQAEYDKLPSGAKYIDPNGVQGTKK